MSGERPAIETLGTTHNCVIGRGMTLCGTERGGRQEDCGTLKAKEREFKMERVSIRIECWRDVEQCSVCWILLQGVLDDLGR